MDKNLSKNKIINLLNFYMIFVSQEVKYGRISPDYFIEKFDKMIGIKNVPKFKPFERVGSTYNDFDFIKYKKLWKYDGELVNNIIYFLDEFNINVKPGDLKILVEKYFGNTDEMIDEIYRHVHPNLTAYKDIYIEKNIRYFKLMNILN